MYANGALFERIGEQITCDLVFGIMQEDLSLIHYEEGVLQNEEQMVSSV